MRVIGTAGHVDHGKSTLVQAMSGIDPDRLREEKERGMTIDLGFAWLSLPTGEAIGIVDVPGHADFIKNMLAGAGGIDAALLVVAADEGVMPQTREHLDIINLLGISAGVVAVTKADLAEDEDWLELVMADIAETIADTSLANAPIIPVSATTGQGIAELLETLTQLLQQTPHRPDKGRPRLFVDRIFTISGFGTVVTGTLIDGHLSVGQAVQILPGGQTARIRGLQSHKKSVDRAEPGSRVAVNLTGVSTDQLRRGDVVTLPDWLDPSQLIDTRLRSLPENPRPLKHGQRIDMFTGSAEVSGYLRLLGTKEILPGEEGWVQIRLDERIPVVKGDRFIIRQPSPSLTIGGGTVIDPLPRRRHRRFRKEVVQRLKTLAHGTPQDLTLELLDRIGPVQVKELAAQSSLSAEVLRDTLQTLAESQTVFQIPRAAGALSIPNPQASKLVVASVVGWQNIAAQIEQILSAFHRANPMRQGMPRSELQSRLKLETGLFNKLIELARAESLIETTDTGVWLAGHSPAFTPAQQQKIDSLLAQFARNPLATPSYKDSLSALGNEALLSALIESGKLLRLSADVLILPQTFTEFVARLQEFVAQHGSITVAQVRDSLNTSRKYALALLEYADAQGLTRRMGDKRVLR